MTEATARRNRPYAPRLSPVQRREQILDVVLEIISTEGVGGVSIDAVARRIGVTRPVVYGQFTDANDMLRSSLKREEQLALAQITDAIPGQDEKDPATSFHHLFDAYLRGVSEAPHRWRAIFMIADSGTPTFHKRVARLRARIVGEFEGALRKSFTAGPQPDSELLAHHLLAMMWESGRLLLVSPKDFTHERLLRSLDAMFTAVAIERCAVGTGRSRRGR
jgi:AcrR family transcriptional regulator